MSKIVPSSSRPRGRRRLRRIAWTSFFVLVVLPVLLVVGVVAALRGSAVRRAVLDRLSTVLREDYGLAFTAEDFSPLWRRSGVVLHKVRLGAPGAAPLATADRVEAVVDLGSLRSRPLVVRSLAADGLRVDLSAPLPKIPQSATPAEPGPPVEILAIAIRRGEVRGAPLGPPAAAWLRSWNAREIEARGSFRGGRLDLEVTQAAAVLDRPGFGRQTLRLAGRVGYEDKKPFRLDGLRVTGDGLRLAAAGTVGLEPGEPSAGRLDLEAEPRALVAGLPPGGRIRANGRVEMPDGSGQVSLAAEAIPAEALKPYLDPKLYADLALAGTLVDLKVSAGLGPRDLARVGGTAQAGWRRGGRRLATAKVWLTPGGSPKQLDATVVADLLPDSPGSRSVQAVLHAAGWAELANATAESAQAQVRLPDVRAALAEARALWPRLVPAPPMGVPLQGSLTADAHLSGSLAAPAAGVDATWLPQPGALVHLQAKGQPRTMAGSAAVRTETLPLELLAAFAPGLAGTVTGTAELAGSPRGYRTKVSLATASLALPPSLQRLESGTVAGEGTLSLKPFSYRGTLSVEGAGLVSQPSASATARIETFRIAADGTLAGQPLIYDGTLTLDGRNVDVPGQARVDHLVISAQGKGGADLRSLAAKAKIDADRLTLIAQGTEISRLHVDAEGDAREVRLGAFSGELPAGRSFGGKFAGSGRATIEPLLAEADLDLHLDKPLDALAAADLSARLRDGVLEVTAPRLDTASGRMSLRARVPLGSLRQVPALASALDAVPGQLATGPVTLSLDAPALDSTPLLAALGMAPAPERVRAGLSAELTLDLGAPAAGQAEVRLSGLSVETPDGRVAAQGPAVLRLAGGRLELLPVHLIADAAEGGAKGVGVDLQASADLSRSWRLTDSAAGLVTRLAADARGRLDAALLNPYLQGGAAAGSLAFSAHASGPLDKLSGTVEASGPGASIFLPSAAVRITDPKLGADLSGGRWTIREGRLGLNGGTVDLAGGYSPQRGVEIDATLAKVRYRLDYGIDTQLSGRLAFRAPPDARGRLSGRVVVDRGVLDRDLNLDREVFTLLFKPRDTPSTEESALAAIDLALAVETADGVRVKNNVGDLRATWRQLTLDGTLDAPVLRGRIDIDPGGLFYAYGQTVRIDSGSLLFTGDAATDPQVSLTTTSSLQDPSIAKLQGESPLDLLTSPGAQEDTQGVDVGTALTAGFANYYGASLFQRLSQSAGLGGFSVRPVLVFNEADPSARLTIGRDLSRNVSLAVSVDLRNAERQTYLFYVQDLSALPGLRAEGFTNDVGHRGGSLQQAFDFGGGERKKETGPRLRRLDVSTPKKGVSKREIRTAVHLEKKQPVPGGAAFGVEVDVTELLRRKGYPGAQVAVAVNPVAAKPGWVDVAVTVEPGPKVSFVFADDTPSRALRPAITSLYRTDFYEAGSIEDMRKAAIRAFRGTGHLDPKVEIGVQRKDPNAVESPRTVTIRTEAGPARPLQGLTLLGLDPAEEQLASASFPGTLARAELAAGLPNADSRLLAALRTLGYPAARITGRSLEDGGLTVKIETGPQQVVAAVRIAGDALVTGEAERLTGLLPLRVDSPARLDLVARGAQILEDDLHSQGYADAKVGSSLAPVADRPDELELKYDVDPGTAYRLAAVALTGERWSRPAPLLRTAGQAGLKVNEPFTEAAVEEARTRLFRTGLFSRVDAEVKKDDGEARVTLGLAEQSRFHLGYGVRWESSVGTAAVLDFVDQNFLGRAITVGLRGLYQTDDRSGRLYLRTGGVLGTPISFESYAEVRRLFTPGDENLVEDRREVSVEAQRPVGAQDTAHLYVRYRTTHIFEVVPDPFFPLDLEIRLPLAGLQLLRDTRDEKIDPRRGLFASLDVSGSGRFLGSDFEYARLFGQVSSFRNVDLAHRTWTWAQSVRLGLAHPFAGQEIIRDELFFVGGPYSVRGYRQETLGPQESLGDFARAAGGEALFVINEELRFALPFSLTGLAFFDAGQVWAHPRDASFDLAKSIGFGLRASTPVGLLRLDAAYPLDRRPGDGRYKLYFGFGNAF
ncbi:MAG TPA: translocation/assembly module TamB domain-containing protein [Thermoanaerobaculia bacterium]|jgi:outer membrane protein assembly factor BamA|nr:translocation/assembly module TamB domain-containing protein [Thermoanaerobaculia bacterium]